MCKSFILIPEKKLISITHLLSVMKIGSNKRGVNSIIFFCQNKNPLIPIPSDAIQTKYIVLFNNVSGRPLSKKKIGKALYLS